MTLDNCLRNLLAGYYAGRKVWSGNRYVYVEADTLVMKYKGVQGFELYRPNLNDLIADDCEYID